jgi:hypothetical protein
LVESALKKIPLSRLSALVLVPVPALAQWIRESRHPRDPVVSALDLQRLGQRADEEAGG